ncbi:MAG TPA: tetraacyldisaccharide 4'-kinase [Longimicrobiales bacterium]|nr:tetraacyldisaccharide 4'-kinase [Longimicrobiales bacterium]
MRGQDWVRRMWRGEAGAGGRTARALLLPVEGLFRLGVALRERRYRRGSPRIRNAPIPVISVGNLSVGGTGKTPVASWVVDRLRAAGATPALVARGYGEDELLLHRRWTPGVEVVADPDRHAGVVAAASRGATVAVLDDGFQHRRLGREADVVLVAAEEGLPGPLLPRGPFREPGRALGRAQAVVVTRKEASESRAREVAAQAAELAPGAVVARLWFRPGGVRPLGVAPVSAESPRGVPGARPGEAPALLPPVGPVLVATGVARPESVVAAVQATGLEVGGVEPFPDHHDFTAADVERLIRLAGGRTVVVTEKDAVKLERLPAAAGADIRILEQELVWEAGQEGVERLLAAALGGAER